METTPSDKEGCSDLPSELGFALAPRETDRHVGGWCNAKGTHASIRMLLYRPAAWWYVPVRIQAHNYGSDHWKTSSHRAYN